MKRIALCIAGCMSALAIAMGCAGNAAPSTSSSSEQFDSQATSDVMSSAASSESFSTETESATESEASAEAEAEEQAKPSNAEAMSQASADMQSIAQGSGMSVGTAAIDLTTGEYAGYRGSESMVSASMIKLIIAAAFLERVQAGDYSLDGSYTLQSSDIVGGTGTLAGLGAGASVTYRELLDKMIDVSDNTAANVLIDAAGGMGAVNQEAQNLGLTATQLNRYMMDSSAMAAGIENYTSADDLATLLKMIYEGTFVNAESSAIVLAALENQQDYGGVLSGLPSGVPFAHKTGSLSTARHDGGIVEGDHPYVLVVLCGGDGFYEQGALSTMSQIASATYADIAA